MLPAASCGSRVRERVLPTRTTAPVTTSPTTTSPTTTSAPTTAAGTTVPTSASEPTSTAALTTTSSLDQAAATAEITQAWQRFFDHRSTLAERQDLLEDGATYAAALEARSKDPLQAAATASVHAVTFTDADHATVTYDVLLSGQVALAGAEGIAVRQGGRWKVSAESFCALVSLGATEPVPGC